MTSFPVGVKKCASHGSAALGDAGSSFFSFSSPSVASFCLLPLFFFGRKMRQLFQMPAWPFLQAPFVQPRPLVQVEEVFLLQLAVLAVQSPAFHSQVALSLPLIHRLASRLGRQSGQSDLPL